MLYTVTDYPSPQDALDDSAPDPQAVVEFPPDSYALAEALVVPPHTIIRAHGALLWGDGQHRLLRSFRDGDEYAGYDGPGNISVYGGTWDCRGQDAPAGEVANAMNFCHGRNITVADATIRNVAGAHAIELGAISGASIRHCRFEGFNDTGDREFSEAIQLDTTTGPGATTIGLWDNTPSRNVTVLDCWMGPSDELGPFGALIGGHSMASGIYHKCIRVSDCHVEGSLVNAFRPYGWSDWTIRGCTSVNTAGTAFAVQHSRAGVISGCATRASGSNGVNVSASSDIAVSSNSIASPQTNYGVWVGSLGGDDSRDVLVTGNAIRGGPTAAVKLAVGTDNCVVSGNLLRRGSGGPTGIIAAGGPGTTNRVEDNDLDGFTTNLSNPSGTVHTE
jgi:hypothetical protein